MEIITGLYRRRYKIVRHGRDGRTATVAIPPEVLEREATKAGMTQLEFTQRYRAIAEYDGFEGVRYIFEPICPLIPPKLNTKEQTNG